MTLPPVLLSKAVPWVLAGLLMVALAAVTGRYLDKRDELVAFKAQVEQMGAAAQAAADQAKADAEANLKKVQAEHETKIPTIRANAVSRYLARVRKPDAGSGAVSTDAVGIKLDDGTGAQLGLDRSLVSDCADDAAKVEAWRAWCVLNRCPVEP